jgi:hypothetical protein
MTGAVLPPAQAAGPPPGGGGGWPDAGLARLAVGTRAPRAPAGAGAATQHLAFLPTEAL